jgi:hypothetical protein
MSSEQDESELELDELEQDEPELELDELELGSPVSAY